jgi:hypothetical protein
MLRCKKRGLFSRCLYDGGTPVCGSKQLTQERTPNAELVDIGNAGHLPNLKATSRLQHIARFVLVSRRGREFHALVTSIVTDEVLLPSPVVLRDDKMTHPGSTPSALCPRMANAEIMQSNGRSDSKPIRRRMWMPQSAPLENCLLCTVRTVYIAHDKRR